MLPAHFHLRSYLLKNTAGAHKEPSKKYKNNLPTLKSKSYKQCRTIIIINHLNSWTTVCPDLIKVLNMSKTKQAFTSSTEM